MLKRLLTGLLLVIYLSVYPAVILCDLHCALINKTGGSGSINAGLIAENSVNGHQDNNSEHHHHSHHQQEQDNPAGAPEQSSFPFHSEQHSGHRYSFCLSAQSVVSIGITAIPMDIAGVFDGVCFVYLPFKEVVFQEVTSNIQGRAPPA